MVMNNHTMSPGRIRLMSSLWNIGYSTIGIAPINTLESYLSVWKCGFNCCKGDLRITSDGKLVMCHDSGFTIDDNGYIGSFEEENNTPIRNLTWAECKELKYTEGHEVLGHYARVASFEDFIRICSLCGMNAYPTVRDEFMDEVLPELVRILKKYNMIYRCIINGTTYHSLELLHAYEKRLAMTYTLDKDEVMTREHVDRAIALENSGITMFYTEPFDLENPIPAAYLDGMEYAREMEVPMFVAFAYTRRQYMQLLNMGVVGFQCLRPVMPYALTSYAFLIREQDGIITGTDALVDAMCWDLKDPNQILYNPIISDDGFREMVLRANRWTMDCSRQGNEIVIKDIRSGNSICDFPDGVLEVWLRKLPCRISAQDETGTQVPCRIEDGKIFLYTEKKQDGQYRILLEI